MATKAIEQSSSPVGSDRLAGNALRKGPFSDLAESGPVGNAVVLKQPPENTPVGGSQAESKKGNSSFIFGKEK
jgi:hypothetical protein